jgi:hypothetical protein
MPDPLDVNHILELLPTLLPRSTSSPLPHTTDALAALAHTIHTALHFRLIRPASPQATDSEEQEETQHDYDDGASETTTAVDQDEDEAEGEGDVEGRLWTGWNHRAEDSYSFEYRHEQSSLTFRLRVGRMGGRIQIDAMAEVSSVLNKWLMCRTAHHIPCLSWLGICLIHLLSRSQALQRLADLLPMLKHLQSLSASPLFKGK